MRVLVITPADPVVTLAEAKAHLKVRHDDEDALIESYIAGACGHIDGPHGWLGRSIGEQELEFRLDGFRFREIELPFPEIRAVDSVKWIDETGLVLTVDPGDYELAGRIVSPKPGKSWPTGSAGRERVRIQYLAGYETVPPALKAAVLLMISDLYRFRETAVLGTISSEITMSTTVAALLSPFRVYA